MRSSHYIAALIGFNLASAYYMGHDGNALVAIINLIVAAICVFACQSAYQRERGIDAVRRSHARRGIP